MCGRFRVEISPKDIIGFYKLIEEVDRRYKQYETWFQSPRDLYPGSEAAILTPEGIRRQTWGFPLDKKLVFNGRSESISEKRMFAPLIREHRCIIPASAFNEWNSKRKFTISTFEPYFFMAGLYRPGQAPDGSDSRFVILTTDADRDMQKIHARMPVILDPNRLLDYLDPASPYQTVAEQLRPWDRGLSIELSQGEQISLLD